MGSCEAAMHAYAEVLPQPHRHALVRGEGAKVSGRFLFALSCIQWSVGGEHRSPATASLFGTYSLA
eukprot:364092-Chlamydomonas_euryale.AAC.2